MKKAKFSLDFAGSSILRNAGSWFVWSNHEPKAAGVHAALIKTFAEPTWFKRLSDVRVAGLGPITPRKATF
jgi:hypothetical protein